MKRSIPRSAFPLFAVVPGFIVLLLQLGLFALEEYTGLLPQRHPLYIAALIIGLITAVLMLVPAKQEILSAVPGMKAKADSLNREVLVLAHELDEHADKADICTDSRVDELSEILSTLQHWNKIQGNIVSTEQEIANDLSNRDKLKAILDEVDAELPGLMSQLDGMVCPLCGRRGLHEEYK